MKTKLLLLFLSVFLFQKSQSQNWIELGGLNTLNKLYGNSSLVKIITDKQNNLYAAGDFVNDSGRVCSFVSKWDGAIWSELGGKNSLSKCCGINAITIGSSSDIYAANGDTINKFDGVSWQQIVCPFLASSRIDAIACDTLGNIYVAGLNEVYKYDGMNWTLIYNLLQNNSVYKFAIDKNQHLLAVGGFTGNRSKTFVAQYTGAGTVWDTLGRLDTLMSCPCPINAIAIDTTGNVYVAGDITDNAGYFFIGKWDGQKWTEIGNIHTIFNSYGYFTDLITDNSNNLYAAGLYSGNNHNESFVAKYNGVSWSKLDDTSNILCPSIGFKSIAVDGNNHVYATGNSNLSWNSYVGTWGNAATGIPTIQNETTLLIFPNPTNTTTTITLTKAIDNATIKLINLFGQPIFEKQNQSGNPFTIDLSNQAAGIYFVEIRQAENIWRSKVVKE